MSITEDIRKAEKTLEQAKLRARGIHEKYQHSEDLRQDVADKIRSLVCTVENLEVQAALDDADADTVELEAKITEYRLE